MTAGDPPSVLVVDDNEAIADTYAAFVAEDYDVRTAYSGAEALDELDAAVDVVLLDRRMPGLSGDEVLAEIGRRSLDCRVVMVTAVEPEFDIVDMPFDEYLVKPVQRADVTAAVEEMRRRSGYDDDLRRFLSLVSKKTTLEREKSSARLAASEEYERVCERIEAKRDRVGVDTAALEDVLSGDAPDIVEVDPPAAGE